ncbi:hypothetical protein E4634_12600 [Mangrovimicrobium sediminis]|uniref:Glycosyltransferase subfamily 4-like N-terminal domain-containing protein n=1 Tax=Mangrovimicrobium sediminis TaxID=2562682 RepID=A0A4Z0M116_9GAMM|nr:glycosyltransferase [Haliea sp. SAOS-164]TGD73114.1 hypothetical protein E4634_12600 [Haliea sp. SAOS-164]
MSATCIVYVSYNGIDEPLVASQVLAYLRELGNQGYRFRLLTFERRAWTPGQVAERRAQLPENIEWTPLTSGLRPRALRDLSLFVQCITGIRRALDDGAQIVHARSFVPALAARLLKARRPLRLLFDIRGFWIDEKAYKRTLREDGPAHRLGNALEGWAYRGSDHIVCLSEAARREITALPMFANDAPPPMTTIPTCVDLAHFSPSRAMPDSHAPLTVGYLGSFGDTYLPHQIFRFFSLLRDHFHDARLHILSRANPADVARIAQAENVPDSQYTLQALPFEQVAKEVCRFDLGISFVRPGRAMKASCPTKLGEYLACGVPVVANRGIGDIETWLADGCTGCLLDDFSEGAMVRAITAMETLVRSEQTRRDCRQTAVGLFALADGATRYAGIYHQLLGTEPPR